MGFGQNDKAVYCVTPVEKGKWWVFEEGFDKPLATFDNREHACYYAEDLAKIKEGFMPPSRNHTHPHSATRSRSQLELVDDAHE